MIKKSNGCNDCYMATNCLINTLNIQEVGLFKDRTTHNHIYRQGEYFGHGNVSFRIFGILKVGSSRTELISQVGERQVINFNLPGELLGLSLLVSNPFELETSSEIFLETSTVCTISFDSFSSLAEAIPKLQQELISRLSYEIIRQQQLIMAVNQYSGEELIAMLLLDIFNRLSAVGINRKQLRLNMPRDDIANYLGLASATVSRILTKFELAGLIDVKSKNVYLKDFKRLEALRHGTKIERKSLLNDRRYSQPSVVKVERREYAQSFA